MIYERARVLELDGGFAWVQAASQVDCARCAAGRGCGGGVFARLLGRRLQRVRAIHAGDVQAGDTVLIGLAESAVLVSSFMAYSVPLLGLLLGAVLGTGLAEGDAGALLGGAAGFGAGLFVLKVYNRRTVGDARFQPVILRRLREDEACFPDPAA